ncbi:MAG: nucleotide exchange factor GrpE [Solirubrobacteraceae bacterium]
MIEAYDQIESKAVRGEMVQALADAGVTAVEIAPQTPFDPKQHKAADTVGTNRVELDGLVASTERPGFVDRGGRRLRWPEVVVYRAHSRGGSREVD